MSQMEFDRTSGPGPEGSEATVEATPLLRLSQVEHQPENPALDIRGYLMFGSDGQIMGRVEDILLEMDRRNEERGLPLYHLEYAEVRYEDAAGLQQWILVPMAVVKETNPQERKVVVRGPAREACQQAFGFRGPDLPAPEDEARVYAFWEVQPRWRRTPQTGHTLVEQRR